MVSFQMNEVIEKSRENAKYRKWKTWHMHPYERPTEKKEEIAKKETNRRHYLLAP